MMGNICFGNSPSMTCRSVRQTAHALTFNRTCLEESWGVGVSTRSSGFCSIGAVCLNTQAFITLDIESKENYIAVPDDVFFAFEPHPTFLFCCCSRSGFDHIFIGYHLGADESALQVGVNRACRFRGFGAVGNCPGAGLLFARGEIRYQAERVVSAPDQFTQACLGDPQTRKVLWALLRFEVHQVSFELCADYHIVRALAFGMFAHLADKITLSPREVSFANIGDI